MGAIERNWRRLRNKVELCVHAFPLFVCGRPNLVYLAGGHVSWRDLLPWMVVMQVALVVIARPATIARETIQFLQVSEFKCFLF